MQGILDLPRPFWSWQARGIVIEEISELLLDCLQHFLPIHWLDDDRSSSMSW